MKTITKLLILSDFFIFTGFGLVSPIIAIFIKENLIGGSIESAGIASMIFILVKAILQPIFAYIAKPRHRFMMLLGGTILIVSVPVIYFFSSNVVHIYLASFVYGLGAAIAYPPWLSFFTRNLTKGAEGFEWSIFSTIEGLGTAFAAYAGAILAEKAGFHTLFIITGTVVFIGLLVLFWLIIKEKMHGDKIK